MRNSIIISGGGTGGHLFASLAFAQYTKQIGYNPIIIGSVWGIENKILPKMEFEYFLLNTKGFANKKVLQRIESIYKFFKATLEAVFIIKKTKPLFVVGFGGYTTVPIIAAAKLTKNKKAILEQNSIPGKANKLLSNISDVVFVNFRQTKSYFNRRKVFITGNPTRNSIYIKNRTFQNKNLVIGVMGGSRGAKSINDAMAEFAQISDKNIRIIHQTGETDEARMKQIYKDMHPDWEVHSFIDNMEEFYKKIDFIICRAGASTLSEIACAALGSVLVPYPYAIYNHQYENAAIFEKQGASIVVEDKNLSGKLIKSIVSSLSIDKLKTMSNNAKILCKRDSCEKMIDILSKLQVSPK